MTRSWPFRETQYTGLTPLEMFWISNSVYLFVEFYNNKYARRLQFSNMTFPVFLKMFRKFLKSRGLKQTETIINEWKHLIEFIYSNFVNYKIIEMQNDPVYQNYLRNCEGLNWYDVLEVSENASQKDIERAFRKQSLLNHPDRCPTEECLKKFNCLGSARDYALSLRR